MIPAGEKRTGTVHHRPAALSKGLEEAQADVAYYQVLAQEKRRRQDVVTVSVCRRCLAKRSIGQQRTTNGSASVSESAGDPCLAKLDLERTVIRAPADGWVTTSTSISVSLLLEDQRRLRWETELLLCTGLYGRN